MTPSPSMLRMQHLGRVHGLSDEDMRGMMDDESEEPTPHPGDQEHEEPHDRFVMCPPKYLSTRIPNNVWMKSAKVDVPRAMKQYSRIKNVIEALGVEVLEIEPVEGCQDQTYVANIAVAIEPLIVLAHYKAPGRDCEVEPARQFFESHGYKTVQPPMFFEGEADLKRLNDDLYFGGYGQFTDREAHDWISYQTGVTIIPIHEVDEKLYHLDCSVLVIDEDHVLVTKGGIDAESLKRIERVADVTLTPKDIETYAGITNAVLIPEKKIVLSGTFNPDDKEYVKSMEWMNKTFDQWGYTCLFLDTDEADKSGADLSCCVMHLPFDPPNAQRSA